MAHDVILVWASFAILLITFVEGQSHQRCPLSCKCDFEGSGKRVRCQPSDSGVNINLSDIDSDVQFLEILPFKQSDHSVFGPSLPPVFQDFPQLQRLIIRDNGIQYIPPNTARQLSRLVTLDLSANQISSLRDLSLDNLPGLDSLQLSANLIQAIGSNDLRPLRYLRALGLTTNRIDNIAPDAFRNQQNIEFLRLGTNRLQNLPSAVFDDLSRLRQLDLSSNQFSAIPDGIQRLRGLNILLLEDNQIQSVPRQFVQTWRSSEVLNQISLNHNPLQCDRSMSEFMQWTQTSDGSRKACQLNGQCPVCTNGQSVDRANTGSSGGLSSRPGDFGAGNNNDNGFVTFQVDDSGRGALGSQRRNVQTPDKSSSADDKLRQYLPGAGMRCGSTKCYYFSAKGTRDWNFAQRTCQNAGFTLVEIESADEQHALMQFLPDVVQENSDRHSASRGWWIGFQYNPRGRRLTAASTGQPMTFYSNWARTRPQSSGGMECVELWDTGDWNDVPCTLQMEDQFICQSNLKAGTPNSGQSPSSFNNSPSGFTSSNRSPIFSRPNSQKRVQSNSDVATFTIQE